MNATETHTATQIFRKTNSEPGRHISVTPANSTNRHLYYGRIILGEHVRSVAFDTGEKETGLIVLSGSATVSMEGEDHLLGKFDGIYLPRGASVQVTSDGPADIAEFAAAVSGRNPVQVVRYSDVVSDPSLKFTVGAASQQRQVSVILGKNVKANRLLLGFTVSDPGNWTSWPPHEHAKMLEEMYVFFDMPDPAYGIQLIYNDTEYPELVTVVRDGDAVTIPSGYHPNVAVPGHRITFLWALAAHREHEDRQYGVVNVQLAFIPKPAVG